MITLHSRDGSHFLGLRQGKACQYEIVYDNGPQKKRLIWQITSRDATLEALGTHMTAAIKTAQVLETLLKELQKAKISVEVDYDASIRSNQMSA